MAAKSKTEKHIENPIIEELANAELEKIQGGANNPPSVDLTLNYEEIKFTRASAKQKTIIGGFKSMSGMG